MKDTAVNDLKIRYIIMGEEKKLNDELKYWFGENFFGYDSLQTKEGKKAYKDSILNTSGNSIIYKMKKKEKEK